MHWVHRLLLSALLAVSLIPVAAWAQSDTGRHRPRPQPSPEEVEKPELPTAAVSGERDWTFGVAAGLLGAGRAFRVETLEGVSVPWLLDDGTVFNASRYKATFDQNLSVGLLVGKGLGRHLGTQASLGYARMDLGAEALAGQTGTVVLLDRVDVLTVGAGVVGKLTAAPSHPFVSAEGVWTSLDPSRLAALDQSTFAWRVGFGFRQVFGQNYAARAQVRLSRQDFTVADFQPVTTQPDPPEVTIDREDHLTFFEFMLSVEFF